MDSAALVAIGGVVGAICRFLVAAGLSGRWTSVAAALVSAIVLAIWGYDAGNFARDTTWEYFMAWVELVTVAAGAFHLLEEGAAMKDAQRPRLGLFLAVGLSGALLAGCATGRTLIDPSPDAASITATQREALRATEGLKTGLEVTRRLGADLPQLGLPAAEARALDCAILRATGTSTPASTTVVTACGPIPLAPDAPIAKALDGLNAVTSCPGLQSTLATVRPFTTPLLDRLDQSSSAAARVIGASLRLSFAVLTPGGVSC